MVSGARATYPGLIAGARAFVLAAIATSALWAREPAAFSGLLALATIWLTCTWLLRTRVPLPVTTLVESLLVAMVAALYYGPAPALLAALSVPPFVHGLTRGFRGAVESLAVQVLMLTAVLRLQSSGPHVSEAYDLFTWMMTGLGLGLIASFFVQPRGSDDNSAAYHQARALLGELNELSTRLVGGLDPSNMARSVLEEVRSELPLESVELYVERDGALVALGASDDGPSETASALAQQAWETSRVMVADDAFAFVVSSGAAPIAVVSGRTSAGLDLGAQKLAHRLEALSERLAPAALRLDTAQLFVSFRDAATSRERQRLAREMHDGMAQDIASMGYVVDTLMTTATPAQAVTLRRLREMISSVVAEVRHSVTTLRSQPGSSESLGAGIASIARNLSGISGTAIAVTVDERPRRLLPQVEAELLRIAQEAMNNAVTHAGASSIDVQCTVDAPQAEITVSDDGRGMQRPRRDSYGLTIMRERAALVDATLEITSAPGHGTRVTVRVGSPRLAASNSTREEAHL